MNLNDFAADITKEEGGKVSMGNGQTKEILRITLTKLAAMPEAEALKIIRRYASKSTTVKR